MFSASCVEEVNNELTSPAGICQKLEEYKDQSRELKELCLLEFRKANGENDVLVSKFPSVVSGLQDTKKMLTDIVAMSDEICEAQSFKKQLAKLEENINRLTLVESCLVLAVDFDANLQYLDDLLRSCKKLRNPKDIIQLLSSKESLLKWWSDCENNSEMVEAFGTWRFGKFSKTEKALRALIVDLLITTIFSAIETSANHSVELTAQLVTLTDTYTVLCADFPSTLCDILKEWFKTHGLSLDALNDSKYVFCQASSFIPDDYLVAFINTCISDSIRSAESDFNAIKSILGFRFCRSLCPTNKQYADEVVQIDWEAGSPKSIQLTDDFVKKFSQFHIFSILSHLPISVKSTMQALSQGSDVNSTMEIIKSRFQSSLPEVLSGLKQLFVDIPIPEREIVQQLLEHDFKQALSQNVYHPLTTSFEDHKLTVGPFLNLIDYIQCEIAAPICKTLAALYADQDKSGDIGLHLSLDTIRILVLDTTVEEISKEYTKSLSGYLPKILNNSAEAPSQDVQKIASQTLNLLKIFFSDGPELCSDIELVLLPRILSRLIQIYLEQIPTNIQEYCASELEDVQDSIPYIIAMDALSLLKLVNSLIGSEEEPRSAAEQELVSKCASLRDLAQTCANKIVKKDAKVSELFESLDHLNRQ